MGRRGTTHLRWPPWVAYSWGALGSERAAVARACVYRSRSWTDFDAEKHETLSKFVDEGGGNYKPDWLMLLEHGTYISPPPSRRSWEEMGSFSITCDDLAIESQILYGCRRSCGRSLLFLSFSLHFFIVFVSLHGLSPKGPLICYPFGKLKI